MQRINTRVLRTAGLFLATFAVVTLLRTGTSGIPATLMIFAVILALLGNRAAQAGRRRAAIYSWMALACVLAGVVTLVVLRRALIRTWLGGVLTLDAAARSDIITGLVSSIIWAVCAGLFLFAYNRKRRLFAYNRIESVTGALQQRLLLTLPAMHVIMTRIVADVDHLIEKRPLALPDHEHRSREQFVLLLDSTQQLSIWRDQVRGLQEQSIHCTRKTIDGANELSTAFDNLALLTQSASIAHKSNSPGTLADRLRLLHPEIDRALDESQAAVDDFVRMDRRASAKGVYASCFHLLELATALRNTVPFTVRLRNIMKDHAGAGTLLETAVSIQALQTRCPPPTLQELGDDMGTLQLALRKLARGEPA
jgi:hypothetical protein